MARAEPLAAGLAAIVAAAVCLSPLPLALRSIAAFALVAYLPGSCLQALAWHRRAMPAERLATSVALSLAATILVGLALHIAGHLDRTGWAVALAALTLVAGSIAALRHLPAGASPTPVVVAPWRLRAASGVVALAVAAGAIGIARHGALTQVQYAYSDFWMVPDDGLHPSSAEVGVRNAEGEPTRYQIDIISRGTMSDQFAPFTLKPGEERRVRVALPSVAFTDDRASTRDVDPIDEPAVAAEDLRAKRLGDPKLLVEARLYKNGDRGTAYRRAWVAVPAALQPPPIAPRDPMEAERSPDDVSDDARSLTRIDAHVIEPKRPSREP